MLFLKPESSLPRPKLFWAVPDFAVSDSSCKAWLARFCFVGVNFRVCSQKEDFGQVWFTSSLLC